MTDSQLVFNKLVEAGTIREWKGDLTIRYDSFIGRYPKTWLIGLVKSAFMASNGDPGNDLPPGHVITLEEVPMRIARAQGKSFFATSAMHQLYLEVLQYRLENNI